MVTNQTFCPNIEVLLRTRQCYYLRRNWPNPLCSTFWDFLEWLDWQKPPLHDWVGSVVFAAKHWYWNSGVVWHVYCKEKLKVWRFSSFFENRRRMNDISIPLSNSEFFSPITECKNGYFFGFPMHSSLQSSEWKPTRGLALPNNCHFTFLYSVNQQLCGD